MNKQDFFKTDELKRMYKQIPKHYLLNKWDLVFYISNSYYETVKDSLHDGRFLGIEVVTD